MNFIMHIYVALLVAGCATGGSHQSVMPTGEQNPYQKSYVSIRKPALPVIEAPRIYRGQDARLDDQRLLEDGFDKLGYSSFEAGDVPPEKVLEQAKSVRAELALVYTTQAGGVPSSVKIDAARAKAKATKRGDADDGVGRLLNDVAHYTYHATYWTRLPPPVLGLHVRDRKDGDAVAQGVIVIVAIKGSPAASVGLLAGDALVRLADTEIKTAEDLLALTRRFAGQTVELAWVRGSETLRQSVTLNRQVN